MQGNHVMTYRTLRSSIVGVALVVLVAGCAEPGAGFFASRSVATDLVPASDLIGTWHGTLGQVRADQYEDEALITLRIEQDGTFTATVTPNRGANNLAKPAKLAGTVVTRDNRVTLRNEESSWPWLTLVRTRDGKVLYGVANDPASEANVMLKFERDGGGG